MKPGLARGRAGFMQRSLRDPPLRASPRGMAALLLSVGLLSSPAAFAQPSGPVTIARLKYDGGGDWYANPSSLPNLLRAIREATGLEVLDREATVEASDATLRDYPFLYMTGHGTVRFSEGERAAIRGYLEAGGFLHADDNYGLDESLRSELARIFPDRRLRELSAEHPVFRAPFVFPAGLPKVHEHDGGPPRAYGIFDRGRLVVLYTYESDLGDGWEDAGVHDDSPETREAALRMGVNIFLYALAQRASDG